MAAKGGVLPHVALASAIGTAEHRVGGFVASLGRVLNVEGYAVLAQDETTRTVRLDLPLVARQFGIKT